MIHSISLTVHEDEFYLSYWFSYMQRVTQNSCVFFNDYVIHKLKNLQLEQRVLIAELNYNTYVFFSHMFIDHDKSTHLINKLQKL